ncbi:MAG: hypothetical protein R2873_10105 [Caldilineaceae bacterium]
MLVRRTPSTRSTALPAPPELDFEYVYKSAASPYYDDAEFERVLRSYADLHGEGCAFHWTR